MRVRSKAGAVLLALGAGVASAQSLETAQRLLDEGRIREAIPHLEAAWREHPGEPAPVWKLAVARLQLGDFDEAAEFGAIFSRLVPESSNGLRLMGSALMAAGRLDEAEAAFRRALERNPGDPASRLDLALLLAGRGRVGEARAGLEALAADWPGRAEILAPLGALHAGEGRRGEALEALTAAARADPDSLEAHHHLGSLYSDLGRFELARRHLDRALELAPGNPGPLSELCLLRSREDRLEEARSVCQQAADAAPEDAETWFRLGDVLQFLQDSAAEAAHRRALELDPGHRKARFRLGLLLEEQNRSGEAIEALVPGVDAAAPPVAPFDLATGLQTLGIAYRSAGDPDRARLRLEQAIAAAPTLPEPHLHLGNLLARSEHPEEAALGREHLVRFRELRAFDDRVRELKAVINAHPGAPGPKRELVRHLADGGAADRALDEAGLLLALSADEPVHHELVAESLLALGRKEEARTLLEAALARWPDNQNLRDLRARLDP